MTTGGSIPTDEGSLLWTLDEISPLVSHSGNAAETLDNIVALIQRRFDTDVCSVYLLEPDRSTLVLAATIGLRQESVGRVRMRLDEGLAGLVAEQLQADRRRGRDTSPALQVFPVGGRGSVPLVPRRADGRSRPAAGRAGGADGRTGASSATTSSAADHGRQRSSRSIVSEARAQRQFVAPSHERLYALARNLWWSWDDETTSIFRELDPVRWRQLDHNPIALLQEMPADALERVPRELVLHSRINYAYRRLHEYLHVEADLGRPARRRAGGAAGRLLLRRVRPARIGADLLRRPRHPRRRSHQGASDLGVPLVGIGLYYDQGYFKQRLDGDGRQREDYIDVDSRKLPLQPATDRDGTPLRIEIETRTGTIAARVWKLQVGRNTLLLLDSDVDGNPPEDRELTARLYGGDERVRIRQELLLGDRRRQGARGARHLAGRRPPERRPQRLCRARADAPAHGRRRASTPCRRRGASPAQVVFTTHTPVPAGHDRFSPDLVEEHLGPLREALHLSPREFMALGRVDPDECSRDVLHDGARASSCRTAPTPCRRCTARSRARCGRRCSPAGARTRCRSATSPTASTCRTWLAPQMHQVYDRHLGPDWPQRAGDGR